MSNGRGADSNRDDRDERAGAGGSAQWRHSAKSIFDLAASQASQDEAPSSIFRLALEIAICLERAQVREGQRGSEAPHGEAAGDAEIASLARPHLYDSEE